MSIIAHGISLAKLVGKLDIAGVNAIGEEFQAKVGGSPIPVIVDLSDVPFMTSIGMRTLLSAARPLTQKGIPLVLLKPQPIVQEVLTIAGVNYILKSYDDLETAIEALATIKQ